MRHEEYMQRCLQLALNGLGTTSPNPLVGSVIVRQGKIIGEGWHHKAGEPHAEVMAIRSVADESLLREATLYVNLEPCAHHGRTPPCSDLIIEKKIPRVVVGTGDPFVEVSGKGIARMRKAGIEVTEGILPDQCQQINKRFFTFHTQKRPYIILKWAQSRDGFLDWERGDDEKGPNWITGKEAKILVHHWRVQEDAILVGAQTAITDNPSLTVRETKGKNPVRLLIDPDLRVAKDRNLYDQQSKTIILNLQKEGTENTVEFIRVTDRALVMSSLLEACYQRNITSILVEGGAETLHHFILSGNWDEARIFTGTVSFGSGLLAPSIQGLPMDSSIIGNDHLQILFRE
ncbi:MAG TPA: bifunctional diaminohydroxyphosphoribosylaminopyrimidine deaminase/5-amino-6-(5-phosphoribosylamino)uracil reductase RibD [Cryomorphaceae bacterium]|nr:riboflavin biosynthesis protein RibD [Owenweeksia sp.]HBF19333.1 bifunctional diaminohydroxyphosphoribosylaminopyrimidine deaminase/5-amino-6-(5-phosphoribosylamino)uracil reductase RibD [Cryomorphaceae bacterium]|tara:strand:- start:1040 stop:2077 length:1038 start_codon:yes stop_codon:yes gene_type:complete